MNARSLIRVDLDPMASRRDPRVQPAAPPPARPARWAPAAVMLALAAVVLL